MIAERLNEFFNSMPRETNPYKFEKWGRGRPTKEKVLQRKLYWEWQEDYRKRHPEETPFTSFLLDSEPEPIINGQLIYRARI